MFTVCPKCTLTLVVTTVDLRAGQGYVRCGRCANVFNALIALREGDPNGNISDTARRRLQETAPTPPVNPAVGAGVAMDEPEPLPEPEPEAETTPEPEPQPEPEPGGLVPEEALLEFDAAATDVSEIFISPAEAEHDTASGNYEAVVLGDEVPGESEPAFEDVAEYPSHTDTIAAEDWSLLDEEPAADDESIIEESPLIIEEPRPQPTATQPDPPWVEEMFAEAEAEAERVRTAEVESLAPEMAEEEPPAFAEEEPPAFAEEEPHAFAEEEPHAFAEEEPHAFAEEEPALVEAAPAGTDAPSDAALEPLLPGPDPRRPQWQYISAVAALLLFFFLQVLHFNRQTLVLNSSVGPVVSKVYGWFGVTLMPRWDLTAYSVKQLGAEAEGGESTRLRVRLSLQNESQRVQPLPLLRLTLQDRFGNAVATRDLEPPEYLPPAAADLRLLEPDQRIDAELHVVDPGRAAFGFEVDACLKAESGAIGCSNDARRRTAG
jgi:predicted Zn finger-like uncharacterized protein